MANSGKDQRKKKRYSIRESTVRYQKGGLLSFLKSRSSRYLIFNISELGLTFFSRDELAVGDTLRLSIEAPKCESPIVVSGEVVWISKSEEYMAFGIGVKFTDSSDETRRLLKKLLDNAVIERLDIGKTTFLKEIEKI